MNWVKLARNQLLTDSWTSELNFCVKIQRVLIICSYSMCNSLMYRDYWLHREENYIRYKYKGRFVKIKSIFFLNVYWNQQLIQKLLIIFSMMLPASWFCWNLISFWGKQQPPILNIWSTWLLVQAACMRCTELSVHY